MKLMKPLITLSLCGCLAAASTSSALDLKQSKLTQVVNDVQIISAGDQAKKNAAVNDVFAMPDILRTGAASRAELVASDETVTRVGANTIFSFDPANRTINLKQGSLLFHSPHGKGGGTIHTGSATASVLGTTLIVTTTANGGMKVLDLEGTVEVNGTNRLKQKLSPGQMTFILPGGNQLAPIIIFRMDDLTRNSLLVHGFNQPLPSLPLINNQVDKQTKLINSGRATDTGLVVGDSATPNQVEVLDLNTIQSSVGSGYLSAALAADATINQPSLTDASLPTPPKHVFPNQMFALPNNAYFANRQPQFTGFAARNIAINTPTVDLSPYATTPEFDLVAANNLTISGAVNFDPHSTQLGFHFALIAGNQFMFAPNASVTANLGIFELSSAGALALNGNIVHNGLGSTRFASGSDISLAESFVSAFGNVSFNSVGNFTLAHSAIAADTLFINPGGGTLLFDSSTVNINYYLILSAAGTITLDNSTVNTSPEGGNLVVSSLAGSVILNGTALQAHMLTVNSGDGILLNGNGGALTAHGEGATANFTAPNLISVNNADFSSFATVNLAANTLNLSDVNFGAGSSVMLRSQLGTLNLGSSVPGQVNFIQNVTYGGNPAQNYVNNGGGITVTTLH